MKLQYLGTAAAEGVPAIFCTCRTCQIAREKGGRNIRSRSQALVDDCLLIDLPADTYWHSMKEGIDLTHIHNILNTHPHEDHLYPSELHNCQKGFANLPADHPKFHFWGGEEMVEILSPIASKESALERICLHELLPFTPTKVGVHLVTALPAYHGTRSPYIYIIEREGKTLLYAHDTGAVLEEVWDYFKKAKPHFDLISFDCTWGSKDPGKLNSHWGLQDMCRLMVKFKDMGLADDTTKVIANHFSHNAPDVNYEDRAVYEAEGYLMSYDGMVVEV